MTVIFRTGLCRFPKGDARCGASLRKDASEAGDKDANARCVALWTPFPAEQNTRPARVLHLEPQVHCLVTPTYNQEIPVPRQRQIKRWTRTELQQLRKMAGRRAVKAIAQILKRSEAAVRFKAHSEEISLALR